MCIQRDPHNWSSALYTNYGRAIRGKKQHVPFGVLSVC